MITQGGYVDSEWGQVHYRRNGEAGPWIALFHESPLTSAVYERVLPLLGRRARAIAFDTPGYGASASPPHDRHDIPDYARVLAVAAERLGMSRPVLVGLHTGASIAIEAAPLFRDGVIGCVLSGVALFTPEERQRFLDTWTPPIPLDDQGGQFAWAIERYRRIWGPQVPADLLHVAVVELLRTAPRYDWGYRAAFRHDPAGPLAALDIPVLLLDAEFDILADKDPLALRLAKQAELVVLKGLPGQPHLRAPEDYAREILAFCDRLDATAPSA